MIRYIKKEKQEILTQITGIQIHYFDHNRLERTFGSDDMNFKKNTYENKMEDSLWLPRI